MGVNSEELGILSLVHDSVLFQGNRTVIQWGLYQVGGGRYPWLMESDVFFPTGYVGRPLFLKDELHLWDYLQELWRKMNQEQMRGLWKEIGAKYPGRNLKAEI